MSPHVTHEHHEANGAGAHPEFAVSNGNHAEPVTNGTAAVNGAAYANGVTATPVNGANGINGTNGNPGVNGTNGTASNNGTNGTNGTSSRGYANGVNGDIDNTNGHLSQSPHLRTSDTDAIHDLICVGFGPASLAVAVALHDALEAGTIRHAPKVLFLEKQARFAWHAGMLLPGAKMQISFIKDLASLRDPRSNFTFLNYLHKNGRLVEFTNLGTFLPARVEYEDYLRWCAGHFDEVVKYQTEVLSVSPVPDQAGPLDTFNVTSRNAKTGATTTHRGKNVLLAIGGQPSIPKSLPAGHSRVIHSSQYAHLIPKILTDHSRPYRVAVVGAGQSAAEIFHNIQTLYPKSSTWLVMRSEFLKPSDDSPFVNSIFNPAFIDSLYPRSTAYRRSLISEARATNYGVVRLELIEHLYEVMYEQRRQLGSDETKWPHRIMGGRRVLGVEEVGDALRVKVCLSPPGELELDGPAREEEVLDADLIISATGYGRSAHVDMLKDTWPLLPEVADKSGEAKAFAARDRWHVETPDGSEGEASRTRSIEVGRDYGVRFSTGAVAPGSGVWLQGCCEGTHGLSDTLLSVLATRSGEIVDSIFRKGVTNGGASY